MEGVRQPTQLHQYFDHIGECFPTMEEFIHAVDDSFQDREERKATITGPYRGDAAVLFPLVIPQTATTSVLDDVKVIVAKRSELLRSNPGDMSFPGGGKEAYDTSLIETAFREAAEELNIQSDNLKFITYMDEFVSSSKYKVRVVLAWLTEPNTDENVLLHKYMPATEEFTKTAIVSLRELLDPHRYSSHYYEQGNRRGYIRYFDISDKIAETSIWGLTASVIRRFLDQVFPDNLLVDEPL